MEYLPRVEVEQKYVTPTANVSAPDLLTCIIGVANQVEDQTSADPGEYDGTETTYQYGGLKAGAVIDLSSVSIEIRNTVDNTDYDISDSASVNIYSTYFDIAAAIVAEVKEESNTGRCYDASIGAVAADPANAGTSPTATQSGTYAGAGDKTYYVKIITGGSVAGGSCTFQWSTNKSSFATATLTTITAEDTPIAINEGVLVA